MKRNHVAGKFSDRLFLVLAAVFVSISLFSLHLFLDRIGVKRDWRDLGMQSLALEATLFYYLRISYKKHSFLTKFVAFLSGNVVLLGYLLLIVISFHKGFNYIPMTLPAQMVHWIVVSTFTALCADYAKKLFLKIRKNSERAVTK